MKKIANLQDLFLLSARRNRTSVTVFLVNGFQMRGVITGFDSFVVILESDGKQQMLYKHAISTIVPFAVIGAGDVKLRAGGCLADIAPTMLPDVGLPVPEEMTGKSIIAE